MSRGKFRLSRLRSSTLDSFHRPSTYQVCIHVNGCIDFQCSLSDYVYVYLVSMDT